MPLNEPLKPKLLVVELWGLGDLVIATPFLQAASQKFDVTLLAKPYGEDLRTRFWPQVRVVSFVAPWTAFQHKYRMISWPWPEILRLRRRCAERYDVGLSARWGDPRDHLLIRALGARRRLGFPRMGSEIFLTDPLPLPMRTAHRYEHWRVLGQALGLDLPKREQIPVGAPRPDGDVLVHTGAGQPIRVWPLDRYRELVARLRERNYRVRVACDPDQESWWQGAGENGVSTPRTVTELQALLDHAAVFIGNDSGPGHLAALTGVPTLTIFGPQLSECFSPLHPLAEWFEGKACPYKPCKDFCRFAAPNCLWDLTLQTVWAKVEEFVGRHVKRSLPQVTLEARVVPGDYHTATPRRFIQVFCRYLMRGGEENSVGRISRHLELAGHEVIRFWRASAEWNGVSSPPRWQQMRLAWNNEEVLGQLRELQQRVQADAWIFHNIIPVVSLGAYHLGRELNVPIIQWAHNYRPISPSGTMRAGGRMLQPNDPWLVWKEVLHGTWHGRLATAGIALAYSRLRRRGDFESVKAWMAISEEMRQLFIQAGYPESRFFCLPHAWDLQPPVDLSLDRGYFLFLGRMVEEKGVRFLLDLWRHPELAGLELVMAGEGPLRDEYCKHTPPNIRWVGFIQGEEKRRWLAGCRALLFPCLWEEPLGMVVHEAYEQGKPVLASALGGLKELVIDGMTGRLLEPGKPSIWIPAILEHARDAALSRERGRRGLSWLREEVSPQAWNKQFDQILQRALNWV